jgi:hypothetical protein
MVEQKLQESRRQSRRDGSYYPFEDGAEGEFSLQRQATQTYRRVKDNVI